MTTALATAAKAQTTAGSDMTAAIVNANFDGKTDTGWTNPRSGGNYNFNGAVEAWHNSDFDLNQKIEGLTNGKYTVTVQIANGENSNTAYLYAVGGGVTNSATVSQSCAGSNFNAQEEAMAASADYGKLSVNASVTDGTLTIGIKEPSTNTWIVFDNFTLTFESSGLTADDYYSLINSQVATADAITGTMSTKTSDALAKAKNTASNDVTDKETNTETLKTHLDNLGTAIDNANASVSANTLAANGSIPNTTIDGWTCTNSNAFHYNWWSKEVDASGFTTPFIENWRNGNDAAPLGDGEIYYTIEDLAAGTYYVSANVRVLKEYDNTNSDAVITGASFFANDGSMNISTETGANTCTHGIYEGVYLPVTVEDGGSIKLGFKISSANFNWISFKDVKISNDVKNVSETVTIGTTGWATYSASTAVDYTQVEGLTAYAATYSNNKITLTPINAAVPANTPVVLKGTASTTYTLAPAASGTAVTNDLKASNNTVTADGTQWCLTTMGSSVGFAPVTKDVVIPAKKAYLVISTSSTAKGFIAIDGSEATGINGVAAESVDNGDVYNVAGQKVSNSYKGLVIKNGKKYLRK